MTLKPEMQAYVDAMAASGLPAQWEAPVTVLRANTEGRPALSGTPENIFNVEHRFIPGPTADLPVRIYRPHNKSALPALVFFHGGGWVLSNLGVYEQALRSLANRGQFIVIAVNYQKAPEHPFPIPFDDCYATVEWVVKNAEKLGIEPSMIGVAGDSAGGNLAAGVAIKARDCNLDLAFQTLIYPCIEPAMKGESAKVNGTGFGLTTRGMKWFWEQYLQRAHDAKNPYAVPSAAKTLTEVAPAIVITAEFDPLLDDGYGYADMLKGDGVTTVYREYEGQIHGFFSLAAVTDDAIALQNFLADEINALLDR